MNQNTKTKNSVAEIVGGKLVVNAMAEEAQNFVAAYQEAKKAEAARRLAEDRLLAEAAVRQKEQAKKGEYVATVIFAANGAPLVRVSYSDSFSPLPAEAGTLLEAEMPDTWSEYFELRRTVTLVDSSDEALRKLQGILRKAIGKTAADELFQVTEVYVPMKGFAQKQFELPASIREMVKQRKATVVPV